MDPNDIEEVKSTGSDRRLDGPVDVIDEAVVLATVEGVGPAIEHMSEAGIDRQTALRVLTSPEHHRPVERVKVRKFLGSLVARFRSTNG